MGVRLAIRTGVNTGEVATGDVATRQTFATGDAVNAAARLEHAAGPGEVLLSSEKVGVEWREMVTGIRYGECICRWTLAG